MIEDLGQFRSTESQVAHGVAQIDCFALAIFADNCNRVIGPRLQWAFAAIGRFEFEDEVRGSQFDNNALRRTRHF
jgi:hypothetical protein